MTRNLNIIIGNAFSEISSNALYHTAMIEFENNDLSDAGMRFRALIGRKDPKYSPIAKIYSDIINQRLRNAKDIYYMLN